MLRKMIVSLCEFGSLFRLLVLIAIGAIFFRKNSEDEED